MQLKLFFTSAFKGTQCTRCWYINIKKTNEDILAQVQGHLHHIYITFIRLQLVFSYFWFIYNIHKCIIKSQLSFFLNFDQDMEILQTKYVWIFFIIDIPLIYWFILTNHNVIFSFILLYCDCWHEYKICPLFCCCFIYFGFRLIKKCFSYTFIKNILSIVVSAW